MITNPDTHSTGGINYWTQRIPYFVGKIYTPECLPSDVPGILAYNEAEALGVAHTQVGGIVGPPDKTVREHLIDFSSGRRNFDIGRLVIGPFSLQDDDLTVIRNGIGLYALKDDFKV